ncbi:hypothetical protein ACN28S_26600 [Cystobacter fuscus]
MAPTPRSRTSPGTRRSASARSTGTSPRGRRCWRPRATSACWRSRGRASHVKERRVTRPKRWRATSSSSSPRRASTAGWPPRLEWCCGAARRAATRQRRRERLLARAKRERVIKRDVQLDDVVCIVTAVALAATGDPARIRRLIAMFFDGMRCA